MVGAAPTGVVDAAEPLNAVVGLAASIELGDAAFDEPDEPQDATVANAKARNRNR